MEHLQEYWWEVTVKSRAVVMDMVRKDKLRKHLGGIIDRNLIRKESCLSILVDGGACHQNLGSRERKGDELI